MHPLEGFAAQMDWAGRDTAHNLTFIPEDRLEWKPAPTANSALEIVNHVCAFTLGMVSVAGGGSWQEPDFTPATDLASAQALVNRSATEYSAALRAVNPALLGGSVELPFGTFPFAQAVSMPVVDMVHHHGQITYIQSLLGDTEMHFAE